MLTIYSSICAFKEYMDGMATFSSTTTVALCFYDYIFGIYIFTANAAPHPHLRFKKHIFCIRSLTSLVTATSVLSASRTTFSLATTASMPLNYRSITISSMATVVLCGLRSCTRTRLTSLLRMLSDHDMC